MADFPLTLAKQELSKFICLTSLKREQSLQIILKAAEHYYTIRLYSDATKCIIMLLVVIAKLRLY